MKLDEKKIEGSFYKNLEFGTGRLCGKLGVHDGITAYVFERLRPTLVPSFVLHKVISYERT
ncbi:hypothetical protein QRY64_29075 [Bacillus albus]|nr:hypothetical protein [Bacillus albus]WJE70700.1 hypothetical protein QRY64_29075 [Bacillus albus]